MVSEVVTGVISAAFGACVRWFTEIFAAINANGLILAVFFLVVSIQLLLIPLRGSGSSDKARKSKAGRKGDLNE